MVLLGGAVALMPIFANDILHTGPRGLGMLRAAPAIGALTMSLLMARFPISRGAGCGMFVCVAIFGAGNGDLRPVAEPVAFAGGAGRGRRGGHDQRDHPRLAAAAGDSAGDARPGERGNSLFIGASNELGEFESGLTAQWWGAVRATMVGGVGALAVAGVWADVFPGLRQADELSAEALRPRPVEGTRLAGN